MSTPPVELSVVIACYRRPRGVVALLDCLAAQTVAASRFEVVVVDDGSPEPVAPIVEAHPVPFARTVVRQDNAGPAAARHHGATLARGPILVFLDDDMILPATFLKAHLDAHAATPRAVVIGHIRPAAALAEMPIFERYHAKTLNAHIAELRATGRSPRGSEVCTGNLSMRRDDYFAIGGFDASLARSEDAELGVRLEKSGARLCFSLDGYSIHASDHTDLAVWLRRIYLYGVYEHRISRKHPDVARANPWHYFDIASPLRRPLLAFAIAAPNMAEKVAELTMRAATAVDAMGLERLALTGTTVVYGLQYFRGVRAEEGALGEAIASYRAFRRARRDDARSSSGSSVKESR